MVLYFTGTGNSRYIAKRIADALGDTLFCMNDGIRAGGTAPVAAGTRLIIVVPTYAWRIPRIVRDWLLKTDFPGAQQAWFVMDCGSEIGNAAAYNRALCREKGLVCMGTAQIVMPENYIALFRAPQADAARQIVARAEPDIDRVIAALAARQPFAPPCCTLYDRLMSGPVNPVFYAVIVKTKAFSAGSACTGCGLCVRLCPLHTIRLAAGKPVWGKACTHCMACICSCPVQAIEYGKKSRGQPRYRFDAL